MGEILLLSVFGLSLTSMAYAACTPPIGTASNPCQCQHPVIENGVLKCGSSYCGDKECMPDGSCCTTPNNAKTECCDTKNNGLANDGSCCPALETTDCETEPDSTTGCLKCQEKTNIKTLCAEANGTVVEATSGTFCMSVLEMSWYDAEKWCEGYGMTMPELLELCPDWNGNVGETCPQLNLSGYGGEFLWTATISPSTDAEAFDVTLAGGGIGTYDRYNYDHAICR